MKIRFVVFFAGLLPRDDVQRSLVLAAAPIQLPSLHVFGASDTVISRELSIELCNTFNQEGVMVQEHDGGHVVHLFHER
jgi:predicted esterase